MTVAKARTMNEPPTASNTGVRYPAADCCASIRFALRTPAHMGTKLTKPARMPAMIAIAMQLVLPKDSTHTKHSKV